MTPTESKNSTNPNRVICFNSDVLVPGVSAEKWSLVKVTCTQPFNKHIQYGLSFVKLRVTSDSSINQNKSNEPFKVFTQSPPKLQLKLREESPDSGDDLESSTGLFKRWQRDNHLTNNNTSVATKPKELNPRLSIKEASQNATVLENINNKLPKISRPSPVEKVLQKTDTENSVKIPESPITKKTTIPEPTQASTAACATKKYRSFDQLMDGVVLVISGIQNPDRAELRSKALALGAKYKANWDNTCTHLM